VSDDTSCAARLVRLSTRYTNKVAVESRVYKNVKLFMENKDGNDELFDRLSVSAPVPLAPTRLDRPTCVDGRTESIPE
jgi:hypothetical protein